MERNIPIQDSLSGSPVLEYIGYIPRDLSRDNWQICRAEVNSFCSTEAASRDQDETKGHILAVAVSEFQIRRWNHPSLAYSRLVLLVLPCRRSKILYASAQTYNTIVCATLDPTSELSFVYVPHRSLRVPISLGIRWSLCIAGPPKTRRPIRDYPIENVHSK